MPTIERERHTRVLLPGPVPERPVFVTDDGRRARRLRRAALAAAALACLWLVGLAVGMLGFDGLPGISVPKVGPFSGHARPARPQPSAKPVPLVRTPTSRSSRRSSARAAGPGAARGVLPGDHAVATPGRAARSSRAAGRQPVPPAQQTVTATTPQHGWARKGFTVPPGQTKKAQPPPPPGSRGQGRGQTTTTTSTVSTPTGKSVHGPPSRG